MRLANWFRARGPRFILLRGRSLLLRYGLSESRSIQRIDRCMAFFSEYGCKPTFFTPGRVVEQHASFIRHLQDMGAEIGVHGYDHVNLTAYTPEEASQQLIRAARTFARFGIDSYGFRCPYLSCTDELVNALPKGMFSYSSNSAVTWDTVAPSGSDDRSLFFSTLDRFYEPIEARHGTSVPWKRAIMLEIPACLPDDLQLYDGLGLKADQVAEAWMGYLNQTHERGELFTVVFHPELAAFSEDFFGAVLNRARLLHPAVWTARLREIGEWWNEKAAFRADITENRDYIQIDFTCSDRATILARGLADIVPGNYWDGHYERLEGHEFTLPAHPRPFVGLPMQTSPATLSFLREQGYIVETGSTASDCGIYIDEHTLVGLTDQVQLINCIESAPGPLIRLWRWPDGFKSAMCITGDLDALTLLDYATRLLIR